MVRVLIIDDHELIVAGVLAALTKHHPDWQVDTAATVEQAQTALSKLLPDVAIVDLSLPVSSGTIAHIDHGLGLIETIMQQFPQLNLVLQTSHVKSLMRIKSSFDKHLGGLTVVDKSNPTQELLTKIAWSLDGVVTTPTELRNGLEVSPDLLKLLNLAFKEGLQDKAIAQRMNIVESTVRKYWNRVQDKLNVYPEDGKNIRIQTEIAARAAGLLD
jgi:DNA-binding NarL/FixJ family response regulator